LSQCRGTADPGAERNPRVRRRLPDERPEHQFIPLEKIDPNPCVGRHLLFEELNGTLHRAPDIRLIANGGRDSRQRIPIETFLLILRGAIH
jgi:hypothetical protein